MAARARMTRNYTSPEGRIDMGSTEEVVWALHREMFDDLPVVLRLVWDGEPVSKSRARFTGYGSKVRAYTPEKTRRAEQRIVSLARAAGVRGAADGCHSFGVFAKFFCGTWQRRDVDNMLKLACDALTGVVWVDDAQVSEMSGSVQRGVSDPRTHLLVYQTKANMPPTHPCRTCQAPVRQYKSQLNYYCSRECSAEGQRVQVRLTCVVCASTYDLPRNRAIRVKTPYCSARCRVVAQTVTVDCATCAKPFTKPKSHARPYCSPECRAAGLRARSVAIPKGRCLDCGGPVSRREYVRCHGCAVASRAAQGRSTVPVRPITPERPSDG